jgi:transposase-like protein
MTDHRKRYDGTFKAKVVLESLKNEKTIAELASDYGVHPNQITQWRKQALEDLPALFSSKQAKKEKVHEEERDELLKQIGQLKVEVEWRPAPVSHFNLHLMELLIVMLWFFSTSVKSLLVNCEPWSVLKISGVPRARAALGNRTPYEVYHGAAKTPKPSPLIGEGIHLKHAS